MVPPLPPLRVFHRVLVRLLCYGGTTFAGFGQDGGPTGLPSGSPSSKAVPSGFVLANGLVEAVLVPGLGRIMQFRFAGETEGPFWHDPDLAGRPADPQAGEWQNFGGDKAWPAPQDDWPVTWAKAWPPPAAFDQAAHEVVDRGPATAVTLSPVDSMSGLRIRREISLLPGLPVMEVRTTYLKVKGEPFRVGVWIVSQLRHPELMALPVGPDSQFTGGWKPLGPQIPREVRKEGAFIFWKRAAAQSAKIGSDGTWMRWADARWVLEIQQERVAGATYPDGGCGIEIYTNPDPKPYIELETLSPLVTLKSGESLSALNRYHLRRRGEGPVEDALRQAPAPEPAK